MAIVTLVSIAATTLPCHACRSVRRFWTDETGQDLVEYSLVLTFIVLVAAAVFPSSAAAVSTIVSKTDVNLRRAMEATL